MRTFHPRPPQRSDRQGVLSVLPLGVTWRGALSSMYLCLQSGIEGPGQIWIKSSTATCSRAEASTEIEPALVQGFHPLLPRSVFARARCIRRRGLVLGSRLRPCWCWLAGSSKRPDQQQRASSSSPRGFDWRMARLKRRGWVAAAGKDCGGGPSQPLKAASSLPSTLDILISRGPGISPASSLR
jgi:hypothetical protein